ncbi:MAG: hypothetical protein AB7K52_12765 [Phycisphaerales bacterium]
MPEDTVRIMCPNLTCRRVLSVPSAARGKTVRCKNCGTNIRVPMKHAKPAPAAAAPGPNDKPASPPAKK